MSQKGPRWKRQTWTVARMAAVLAAAVKPKHGPTPSLAEMEKRFGIGLRELMHLNNRLGSMEDVSANTQFSLQFQFDGGRVRAQGAERLSQLTRLSRVQAAFAADALDTLAAEPAQRQFSQALAAKLRQAAGPVDDQLLIYRPSDPAPTRAKVALLNQAMRQQWSVAFEYRGPASKSAGRVGNPLSLRRDQGTWRVLCLDHLRDSLRTFNLDHMTKIVVTAKHFEWPAGMKKADLRARDLSVYQPTGKELAVKLKVSARVADDWASAFKSISKANKAGFCDALLMAGSSAWVLRTFLPLCDEVKIISPAELKKAWDLSIQDRINTHLK